MAENTKQDSFLLRVIGLFLEFIQAENSERLTKIEEDVQNLMATVAELTAAVETVKSETAAAIARVAEDVQKLKDDIANGGTIKEADLDPIKDSLAGIVDSLKAVDPLPDFPVKEQPPVA